MPETLIENKNPEIKTQIEPKKEIAIDNQVKTQATVQNITEQNLVKTETIIEPIIKVQETNVETKTAATLDQKTIIQESKPTSILVEKVTTKNEILPTTIQTPEVAQSQKIPATIPAVALPNRIKQIYLPNTNNQIKTQIKPTIITEVNLPITEVAQILEIKSTEQPQIANIQNTIQVENQPKLNANSIIETQTQTPKVDLESKVVLSQVIEPKTQTIPIQESISEQQFINQNSNLVSNQEQNGNQNQIDNEQELAQKPTQKPLTTWFQNQPSNIEQITQNQSQSNKNQSNITNRKLQLEPMSTNWIIFGIGLVVLSTINNINKSAKNLMITNYSKTYSKR